MIFKAISWSQIALSKCITTDTQFSSSAWFLAEAMVGCTDYLAEFFQAALNMKVLLVGQSFCFQSSVMKKICVKIVFLLCLLLPFCRKRGLYRKTSVCEWIELMKGESVLMPWWDHTDVTGKETKRFQFHLKEKIRE